MGKFFISAVRYDKLHEDGRVKKVTELFLVNALTFTECEVKVTSEVSGFGDFYISSEKRTDIKELFVSTAGDSKFYSCKVNIITINERNGKEKKTGISYMVRAGTIDEAKKVIEKEFSSTIADYEIAKIAESQIVDVIE